MGLNLLLVVTVCRCRDYDIAFGLDQDGVGAGSDGFLCLCEAQTRNSWNRARICQIANLHLGVLFDSSCRDVISKKKLLLHLSLVEKEASIRHL
jgi:hypothetical protein